MNMPAWEAQHQLCPSTDEVGPGHGVGIVQKKISEKEGGKNGEIKPRDGWEGVAC